MAVTIKGTSNLVLQVVSGSTSTPTSTTSTSYVTTTITASITPSSTANKIFVFATVPMQTSGSAGGGIALYRNGSKIFDPSARDSASSGYYINYGVAGLYIALPLQYVDSPASISAQTYSIWMASYGGSNVTIPFAGGSGNSTGTLTLMEIAA
jgi:hypothetical protein